MLGLSLPPSLCPRLQVACGCTKHEGHPGHDHSVAICGDHHVLPAIPDVDLGNQAPFDKDNLPSNSPDNDGLNISPHYFIYIGRPSRICEKATRNI